MSYINHLRRYNGLPTPVDVLWGRHKGLAIRRQGAGHIHCSKGTEDPFVVDHHGNGGWGVLLGFICG